MKIKVIGTDIETVPTLFGKMPYISEVSRLRQFSEYMGRAIITIKPENFSPILYPAIYMPKSLRYKRAREWLGKAKKKIEEIV